MKILISLPSGLLCAGQDAPCFAGPAALFVSFSSGIAILSWAGILSVATESVRDIKSLNLQLI